MTVSAMMNLVVTAEVSPLIHVPQHLLEGFFSAEPENCRVCNCDVRGYGQIDKSCRSLTALWFNDVDKSAET